MPVPGRIRHAQAPIVAPSVLTADYGRLAEEVRAVYAAGAEWLHLDVMDGVFVPNISFGADVIAKLRPHSAAEFDVHLMIAEPDRYISDFRAAGADRITVHAESAIHLQRTLTQIRKSGAKVGVALNPGTPLSAIDYILDDIDQVLVMSVNPGYGGQRFIPAITDKIVRLADLLDGRNITIVVDGGVSTATAAMVWNAGADVFVAGSAVFQGGHGSYQANVSALKNAAMIENV